MITSKPKELSVLLFDIENSKLILPDIAVAEIIDYQQSETADNDKAHWYLGNMQWRNTSLPVIYLEGLNNDEFAFKSQTRMKAIVVHSLIPDQQMKYWAFVTSQAPKLQNIDAESLVVDSTAELGAVQKMSTELYGEPVLMVDMEQVEKLIRQQL